MANEQFLDYAGLELYHKELQHYLTVDFYLVDFSYYDSGVLGERPSFNIVLHRRDKNGTDVKGLSSNIDHIRIINDFNWGEFNPTEGDFEFPLINFHFIVEDGDEYTVYSSDEMSETGYGIDVDMARLDPRIFAQRGIFNLTKCRINTDITTNEGQVNSYPDFWSGGKNGGFDLNYEGIEWRLDNGGQPSIILVDELPHISYPDTLYMIRS